MLAPNPVETHVSSLPWEGSCHRFSLVEIQSATGNFDDALVIGQGGFGKVYKGPINYDGITVTVAIKRLGSWSNQGANEFWAEVRMLSRLRHCHLVSLLGYCNDGEEMILVYEYVPHGSLEDRLHRIDEGDKTPLSWLQRLKICLGAARGLDYLHTGTGIQHGIIHRDVKSSNILLDENCAAKISDFGLSKVGPTNQPSTYVNTRIKGTFGYVDPDYYTTGRLTRKSDVYAFGVILFEVLCGRRAVDRSLDEEDWGLVGWVQDNIKEGKLGQMIDPSLRGQVFPKCLKEFALIAERCLHSRPKKRPAMDEVVVSLANVLALQEKMGNSLQSTGIMTFPMKVKNILFGSVGGTSAHEPSWKNNKNILNGILLDIEKLNRDGELMLEGPPGRQGAIPSLKEFKFSDLKSATRNFHPDLVLGQGGFGMVFLGTVDKYTYGPSFDGPKVPIAVKRLSKESCQGHAEWLTEVTILNKLRHSNVISLLGYCIEDEERLLVYEYMSKGSFDYFIHGNAERPFQPKNNAETPAHILSWETRVKIVLGAAHGLTFLHTSEPQVVHCNVRTTHILLDQDFNPKIGDFGLAKPDPIYSDTLLTTDDMVTYVHAAREYLATGHFSAKCDVYSFGVVLLETLTGQRAIDIIITLKGKSLVDWFHPLLSDQRKLKRVIDPKLEGKYPPKAAFQYALLTLQCLHTNPRERPTMYVVLNTLEQIKAMAD